MKLDNKSVTFRNFLSYGNQPTTLDLTKGINLVLGHDKDTDKSNTSGKSNLLMTIPFALFGKIPKDIKKSRIPNWKNRKNCEVAFEFNKGENNYIFKRGIAPDFFEVYENGKKIPVETDMKTFQSRIEEEILGIDYNFFKNYAHCNPNNTISIVNTPKEQKRKLLETLFNVEVFSKMNVVANEKLRNLNQKMELNEKELESLRENVSKLEKEISGIHIPDIEELEREYNKWKEHYDSLFVENIDGKIQEATNIRKKTEDKVKEIEQEIKKVDDQILEFETEKKTLTKQVQKATKENADKDKKYKELLEEKKKIPEIGEHDENEINETIEYLTDKVNELNGEIKSKQALIDALPDPDKLEGKSNCPTCGTEIDPENIREHTETEKERLEAEKSGILEKKKEKENSLQEQKKELKKIQEVKEKQQELDMEISGLSNVKEKQEEIESNNTRLNEIEEEINSLKEYKQSKFETEKNKFDKLLEEYYIPLEKEWNTHKEKLQEAENSVGFAQQKFENSKDLKEREEERLQQKQEELDDTKKRIEELEKEEKKYKNIKDHLNFSKTLLKDENLKQYAISSHIPFFNSQVNSYLSQVGFNFYLSIDKWMDLSIHGPGIGDASINNLSGGQVKSIDLAIKFSLMDMAKMQASSYPDTLILDEILDSSIDKQGLEEVMEIVRHKKEKDDLKVFIVSHREEMKDMEAIDKIYNVWKNNEISKLEEK